MLCCSCVACGLFHGMMYSRDWSTLDFESEDVNRHSRVFWYALPPRGTGVIEIDGMIASAHHVTAAHTHSAMRYDCVCHHRSGT